MISLKNTPIAATLVVLIRLNLYMHVCMYVSTKINKENWAMDLIWCQKNMKGFDGRRAWGRNCVNRIHIYKTNKNSKFKK